MIRALLKKQLLELGAAFVRSSKTGKRRSRAGAFGYALLFAALMLLVMLSFGSMALPLAVTLVPQGLDWLYFVLMELSALTVSVLASAFTSYGHLFRCRDNQQLLALPIPPGAIFAVRSGGVYLTGLIYLLLAWVPSVVCYALAAPRPGEALLAALPVALALAGVSMVLVVLLGWAVALLNRRARHKSLVTIVGTLLFLAVYYAVFQWVGNSVEALAVDAVQAGAAAGRAAAPLRLLGLAAVGNVPALLLFLALAAACMALCGKALAKPYLRLLTLEPGRAKVEYRAKTQKKQPPRRALLRRELLHLGACPMWLLNWALSSLLLPVLGAAALWKAADLRAFTAAYPPESLPMLVCGMVCTIAAMNFITAPSVSLEGGTLWLLQSLPVAPQQVLRVKVELQLLLTLPGAWFCAGCAMAALRIPAGQGLLVLAVLAAFVWLTAQMGLALGLCLPNLHWVSEAAVVKQSAASMLATLNLLGQTAAVSEVLLGDKLAAFREAAEKVNEIPAPVKIPDLAAEPTVTILWSESDKLQDGEIMPLSVANRVFEELDTAQHTDREKDGYEGGWYDKTAFRIDFTLNGQPDNYEGRQDFGDGDGSLIQHIQSYHEYYAKDENWKNFVLHNKGTEAWEQDKAEREMVLTEFIPYLKQHCNLSAMEQTATAALREGQNISPEQAAYYNAVVAYVQDCRPLLNQGQYNLPEPPKLADFDQSLQDYKAQVQAEIEQKAADAGMTVEEYAAAGFVFICGHGQFGDFSKITRSFGHSNVKE